MKKLEFFEISKLDFPEQMRIKTGRGGGDDSYGGTGSVTITAGCQPDDPPTTHPSTWLCENYDYNESSTCPY